MKSRRAALLATAVSIAVSFAGAAELGAQRFVAFGDSITLGVGDETGQGGYPPRLERLLVQEGLTATVENRGKDGETTAQGLSRINTIPVGAGDRLILMEGTNDAAQQVSIETAASNLEAIVRKATQRGFGPVYFSTIVPRGRGAEERGRLRTDELAIAIRQSAFKLGTPQPDPYQVFVEVPGYSSALFGGDTVHPNAAGYDLMAEQFRDQIVGRDEHGPASGSVTPENGAVNVAKNAKLQIVVYDAQTGVDLSRATLTLNGEAIATTVTGVPRRVVLSATPGNLSGVPHLGIDVFDQASPPNRSVVDLSIFVIKGTTFLKGDLDQSGRVDGSDLVTLARAFGSAKGDGRYAAAADIDGNNRVDGADLAILASNFGKSS